MSKTRKNAHLWARDPHDWYVEPVWCSARLFEREEFPTGIYDPACGCGRIIKSALNSGVSAFGSDICERLNNLGPRIERPKDFLKTTSLISHIVCNPPFKLADHFVKHSLAITPANFVKIAMLLPATWHLGDKRARWLRTTPLYKIYFLTPRPSMPPGAVIEAGEQPGGGRKDFAWFIWLKGYEGPVIADWLHRDKRAAV